MDEMNIFCRFGILSPKQSNISAEVYNKHKTVSVVLFLKQFGKV